MEFGEKMQLLRKERGLTQASHAEELYVSRAAVFKWESGRGYPGSERGWDEKRCEPGGRKHDCRIYLCVPGWGVIAMTRCRREVCV